MTEIMENPRTPDAREDPPHTHTVKVKLLEKSEYYDSWMIFLKRSGF